MLYATITSYTVYFWVVIIEIQTIILTQCWMF